MERPIYVGGYRKRLTTVQLLIVLVLAVAIVGGGGYLAYDALNPYRFLSDEPLPKWVHPIVGEMEKARKLRAEGKLNEAQEFLRTLLRIYPKRPEAKAARKLLGKINTEMFFSTKYPFGKTQYVVERGDSLWRIARKLDSTPEIIQRTNNLESTRLRPGDRLWVPTAEFTVTLDLPNERVVVHTGNEFFKQYPIVAINLRNPIRVPITTRITGVSLWKAGVRVTAPEEGDRDAMTPWLHLGSRGYILYGVSDEEGVADNAVEIENAAGPATATASPRGFAMHREDLQELQLLIERGTPVTIIGQKK
ncbi:MAG TPA: LysM peptidoglycan-binding domain-containing protein [Chthoniobacterales bacterium]|nr:LysM peptidoglycan-binding domain-containing protein [Chthoniobacterales bacterium]